MEAGCCGYVGTDWEGIIGVWDTADGSHFVQLLGMNVVVIRRQLAGSGTETTEGAGKVGTIGEVLGEGGREWIVEWRGDFMWQ